MKEIKVKLTFTEPVLGTCPGDPDIYRTFVASNSPDAATTIRSRAFSRYSLSLRREVKEKRRTA